MSTLVIFSGLPGTGKSTLANRLARELQWPLLKIDDVIGDVPENAGIPFWDSRVAILMELIETQLNVGLSVIADSVFMNTDRHHARALAEKYQARFRPIYTLVSDDQVWEKRVTARVAKLNHPDVATWAQVLRQRDHFRPWEPDTALFVDAIHPTEQNYEMVLQFVTSEDVPLKPLEDAPWAVGRYHG